MLYLIKVLISAAIIVLVTEVAKKSPQFAALIASIPLVSVIALTWMYYESSGNIKRLQSHSLGVFWYVLPSLVFFILFPLCLNKMHFWWSLALSAFATFLAYLGMIWALAKFGIKL